MLLSSLIVQLGIAGVSQTIAGMNAVQSKIAGLASGGGAGGGALGPSVQSLLGGAATIAGLMSVVASVRLIAAGIHEAVDEATSFSRQVLNIQALTGATASQAAQFATMFKITGSEGGMRDILELTQAMKSAQGLGALSQLGVRVNINQSGLTTLMEVIERLKTMPDSPRKAQLEMQIFGLRGVQALQGILRLSAEQMAQVKELSQAFSGEGAAAISRMQVQWELLSMTIMQRVVIPLLVSLLPAVERVVTGIIRLVNWMAKLGENKRLIEGLSIAFWAIAGALIAINVAMNLQNILLTVTAARLAIVAAWDAVIDALTGNWVALAAGAVVGAAVGFGINALNQRGQPVHDPTADAVDNLHATVREIHATMIGGGERTSRVKSELEAEMSIRRAVFAGNG